MRVWNRFGTHGLRSAGGGVVRRQALPRAPHTHLDIRSSARALGHRRARRRTRTNGTRAVRVTRVGMEGLDPDREAVVSVGWWKAHGWDGMYIGDSYETTVDGGASTALGLFAAALVGIRYRFENHEQPRRLAYLLAPLGGCVAATFSRSPDSPSVSPSVSASIGYVSTLPRCMARWKDNTKDLKQHTTHPQPSFGVEWIIPLVSCAILFYRHAALPLSILLRFTFVLPPPFGFPSVTQYLYLPCPFCIPPSTSIPFRLPLAPRLCCHSAPAEATRGVGGVGGSFDARDGDDIDAHGCNW
ncbi:hypothetical protein C8J57DRAFT_1645260 [Mycena rebaudengoi]|nr:hypothetical protein C8J57DRAFT_1645260 [Mycena rebaudengoi]